VDRLSFGPKKVKGFDFQLLQIPQSVPLSKVSELLEQETVFVDRGLQAFARAALLLCVPKPQIPT
jgi:hypothetical protein